MWAWRQRSVSSSEVIEIAGQPSGARRESWNWFSLQVQEETNPADFAFELPAFIIVRMNLYCLSHTGLVSFQALKSQPSLKHFAMCQAFVCFIQYQGKFSHLSVFLTIYTVWKTNGHRWEYKSHLASYTITRKECGAPEHTTTLFLIIGYKIIFLPNLFQSDI